MWLKEYMIWTSEIWALVLALPFKGRVALGSHYLLCSTFLLWKWESHPCLLHWLIYKDQIRSCTYFIRYTFLSKNKGSSFIFYSLVERSKSTLRTEIIFIILCSPVCLLVLRGTQSLSIFISVYFIKWTINSFILSYLSLAKTMFLVTGTKTFNC